MANYTFKKGDNLWDIGRKYGVNWQDLKSWNNISNHYQIPVGTTIRLNAPAPAAPTPAPAAPAPVAPAAPTAPPKPNFIQETANAGMSANPVQLPNQAADLSSILKQSSDMLAPLIQNQKNTATSTMNQQMQKLSDQWASRGLLSSGIAATQQRQGAEALASQLTGIDAQGQADALANTYQLGNFQEGQRQFDLSHALEEANVTGRYLPAGTRDLVNQLVQQRQIVENPDSTTEQRTAATQQANSIRAALNQMGVNTGSFGRDSSLQDILNTMAGGNLGQQTQTAQEFNQNLAWQQQSFDREMDLKENSEQFRQEMEQRVQQFQEKQAEIDNQLARQGVDLDRARLRLQELQFQSDDDYRDFQIAQGIDQESARRATSSAMAQAMSQGSLESAYTWLHKNADKFYQDGVDVGAVIGALENRWGAAVSGGTTSNYLNP